MSNAAITIENLGKMYRLNHQFKRYNTFRDAIVNAATGPIRRLRQLSGRDASLEEFWALRNVSFEVRPGEVIGIIGRNGAGKSTLLKVLSRIVEPTEGRAILRGRVASLLEVGTGFHPELTGRENIYLNGSILGMKRREIDVKFDEIVAFAEVEKFLDTPVKRYSSGMYVRLAFAVAAHLEPEILIVDEVLAVGDAEFQQKCLGKMKEVSQNSGRTVLFVSHNMPAVRQLCNRGILIAKGTNVLDGTPDEVIAEYLGRIDRSSQTHMLSRTDRKGRGSVRFASIDVLGDDGISSPHGSTGRSLGIEFRFNVQANRPRVVFTIYDVQGAAIANFDSARFSDEDTPAATHDVQRVVCQFPELLLLPGRYRLNAALFVEGTLEDHIEGAAVVDVVPGAVRGRSSPGLPGFGQVTFPHQWQFSSLSDLDDQQSNDSAVGARNNAT